MREKALQILKTVLPPSGSCQRPYEWMVKETPQKEWIEEQGVFLWLAFFFSEIGAGLYFIAMFSQYRVGLVLGWLITLVLGGVIHMRYLGNPKRFWRIFLKPKNSELSRGVWTIAIFGLIGFLQILSGSFNAVLNTIMAIVCILIIMHGFATMNVMRALPAWSSTLVLPLSIVSGVWGGSQILQVMVSVSNPAAAAGLERWAVVLFLSYIVLLLLYLWGTFHSSETARVSVNRLLKGDMSRIFYIGMIGIGIVLPLLITGIMWGGNVSGILVFLRLILVVVGDLVMRYLLMRSAVYTPLV